MLTSSTERDGENEVPAAACSTVCGSVFDSRSSHHSAASGAIIITIIGSFVSSKALSTCYSKFASEENSFGVWS